MSRIPTVTNCSSAPGRRPSSAPTTLTKPPAITIDFSLLFGSAALTGGRPAYINCTRNVLLRDVITLLPRDRVVVEVLEDVIADRETIAACDRLRRAGYLIALDDYVPTPDSIRLLPFADMVKVDFLTTDAARQASIAADMRRRGIKLLAEKVESREQFQYALHLGYHYFQGYFFCKPQTLTLHDIPCAKLSYIHVLSIANRNFYRRGRTGAGHSAGTVSLLSPAALSELGGVWSVPHTVDPSRAHVVRPARNPEVGFHRGRDLYRRRPPQ